jgi:hypothetical protein
MFIFPSASQSSVLSPQSNPFQTRWGGRSAQNDSSAG